MRSALAAALVLACSAVAAQQADAPARPPLLPPAQVRGITDGLDLRPLGGQSLRSLLRALGPPEYAPAPRGAAPAPGSATESEALRRYVRAALRLREGQPRRSMEDLDAALRLDPSSADLHRARAMAAGDAGDISRAVAEWESVLALTPQDRAAALAVGIAAAETGQHQRAVSILGPVFLQATPAGQANQAGQGTPAGAPAQPAAERSPPLAPSERYALGTALARALLRMGSDEAALEPAAWVLALDPAAVGAERGEGMDAVVRSQAQLACEAGEAALRMGRTQDAAGFLLQSVQLVPAARAQALAGYSALLTGHADQARAVLAQILAHGAPGTDAQTLVAEWLLRQLGGDQAAATRLSQLAEQAPGDGRVARLLAAANPARATAVLDAAIVQGAVDRATLRAAFDRLQPADAVALAMRVVRTDPALVRTAAHELVRSTRTLIPLHAALDALPRSAEALALRAAVAGFERNPGTAWALAVEAREAWPDEPAPFFAQVEAALAAGDPALLQHATVDAPDVVNSDPSWHAEVARAAAAVGLQELASASLARCQALDPAGQAPEEVRAAAAGNAPPWSPRGRAEQAIAMAQNSEAMSALLEARALEPDDDVALGMLLRLLSRELGAPTTWEWTRAQLDATPNDPVLWDALALQALTGNRVADALGTMDARLSADPDDTLVLGAREALLRAAGRGDAALLSARARAATLPAGPRKALELAAVEAQGGDPATAVEALRTFAESAFPPPLPMRAAALDLLVRVPAGTTGRAEVMRRIARDAILSDSGAPLEFFAFEALSAGTDPSMTPQQRADAAAMLGLEAAASPVHRQRAATEPWRAAADFLVAQAQPEVAAEFLRGRLEEHADLDDAALELLARAAFACDALAGKGTRASNAMQLLVRLRAAGRQPLGSPGARGSSRPAADYTTLADIFTVVGDADGSQRVLDAARAVDPGDPVTLNNLSYARATAGNVDDATLRMAQQAVAGQPNDPSHLDTLGWVLYLRGQVADQGGVPGALSCLEMAVQKGERTVGPDVFLHLGDARWKAGNAEGAAQAWQQAVDRAGLLDRERALNLYRQVLRRQTSLAAVDPARLYEEHDASVAARAKARLSAVAAHQEPPVAAVLGAPAAADPK